MSQLLKARSKDVSLVGPLASLPQRSEGNSSKVLTIHLSGHSGQILSASLSAGASCLSPLQGGDFQSMGEF